MKMREQGAQTRAVVLYFVLLLFGATVLRRAPSSGWATGLLLVFAGGTGLLLQARQIWNEHVARRRREAQTVERERLRVTRRERSRHQKEMRLAAQRQTEQAHERREIARKDARDAQWRLQQIQREIRAAQERETEIVAARILGMSQSDLYDYVVALLIRRGLSVVSAPVSDSTESDTTLPAQDRYFTICSAPVRSALVSVDVEKSEDVHLIIVRCLLHRATVADMQDLEKLRCVQGAREAYLVAVAGFSPAAVRLARELPITPVEAHLLAHWDISNVD